MFSTTFLRMLLGLVLAAAVAGCGEPGTATGPDGEGGGGEGASGSLGEWVLVDGVPLVDGYPVTLHVSPHEVTGTAACNSYSGEVRMRDDAFEVGDIARTEMGCPEPGVHESESAFLDALLAVDRHARDGEQLVLTAPDVELRFEPAPPEEEADLTGTVWRLDSLLAGAGPDGSASSTMAPAELQLFGDGQGSFEAGTGCNALNGTWEGDEERIRFTAGDRTDAACDVEEQEEHIEQVLGSEVTVELSGSRLTLWSGDLGLGYRAE